MMRIFTKEFWDGRDMEMFIGRMLRTGVVTASIICIIGGLMYMFRDGSSVADYSQFTGSPEDLRGFAGILHGLMTFEPLAIVQLGVVVLLATPILRVAFSILAFLIEKDYLYVVITCIVLAIILINMIDGVTG